MSTVLKILRNFLVANILLFLPVVLLVSWHVPERLEINVRAPAGLAVKVGFCNDDKTDIEFVRVMSGAGVTGLQTLKSYFADPIDKEHLALAFIDNDRPFELDSISILKHCFVRETLSADDFKRSFECNGDTYVPKVGLGEVNWTTTIGSDRRLVAAVLIVEAIILLACCLALLLNVGCPRRKNLIDSFFVSLLTAFFFCVVVPLQSFLVNRSIFEFSLLAFWGESICLFLITLLFLFGVLYYSERCFGRMIHLFILSVVLYEYLETGVLALGMPQLNGETWFFANKQRQLIDTVILLGIVGIPLIFYHWIKDVLHWVALGLLILCFASLFDIRTEKQTDTGGGFNQFFVSQMDVAKNAIYSPQRNVFVFILDSVTVDAASDVMATDEELRHKFSGITAFCNNVGMGPYTHCGLPGIMTGKYEGDGLDGGNYAYSIFTEKSLIAPYLRANAYVGFTNGLYDYGVCSNVRMVVNKGKTGNVKATTPFSRRTSDLLGMNLSEVVRFRLTPFALKSWYLTMIFMGMDSHAKIGTESTLYPILKAAPVDASLHLTLHIYHTHGSHPPIAFDKSGNSVRLGSRDNYEGFVAQTHFVLRQLGSLFDHYKTRGIYDKSLIIICADHGSIFAKPGKNKSFTPRAFPMLWVKPENSVVPYRECYTATSHARIATLLHEAQSKTLNVDEIEAILHVDKRLYREGNLTYVVEANGDVRRP